MPKDSTEENWSTIEALAVIFLKTGDLSKCTPTEMMLALNLSAAKLFIEDDKAPSDREKFKMIVTQAYDHLMQIEQEVAKVRGTH